MLKDKKIKDIFKERFQKLINTTPKIREMSQKEIASEIGISQQSLTDYLSKAKFPDTINYIKIVKFFNSKIKCFNEYYLIGESNSIELTTKNLIPAVNLSEGLIEQLRPYLANQEDLETLLSIPHMKRLARNLNSIKKQLKDNIQSIIDYWPEIKKDYDRSPYMALQKLLKYDDDNLVKDIKKSKQSLNDQLDLSPYTLIRDILKNLINDKTLRTKRDIIKDLDSFIEKNAGELKFIIQRNIKLRIK